VKNLGLCDSSAGERSVSKSAEVRNMKTLKIGIVLLAFLLAAMVMVPMVSATENVNYTLTSDLSRIPFPQLHFNASQKYTVVNSELDPDPNTQVSHIMQAQISSQNAVMSKIPYGSIIYHSNDGITTVFDANGNQLFAADDAHAPKISTPAGLMPATHVVGLPSGSEIIACGNVTYISYQNVLLAKEIDKTSSGPVKPSSAIPGLYDYPNYVEGINGTPTSSTIDDYVTYWTVPTNPQQNVTNEYVYLWNGIQSTVPVPNLNVLVLIQPVLQWNVQAGQWNMASWVIIGATGYHSNNVGGVASGHVIMGQMSYNPPTATWTILTRDTSQQGLPTATYLVTNTLPDSNNEIEAYLEAYVPGLPRYFPGPTSFYTFLALDRNFNNCLPSNITVDYNPSSPLWTYLTKNIANSNYWPNTINHPLIFTTQ
jgi:hypothetical protein